MISSPRESLRDPWATSCTRPIASRTWLGSSDPEVQALPEEALMPRSSRRSRSDSPSIPSKQKLTLPGSLFFASPFRAEWGIFERPSISRSRRAVWWAAFCSRFPAASLRAAAMAIMPGTFSVPARLPFSWAPPSIRLVRAMPFLAYKKPVPLGP